MSGCRLIFGRKSGILIKRISYVRAHICSGIEVVITGLTRNQVSYAECQTAETLGTMRVPAEFKLNNVACSILLFFPISTG